MEEMHNGTCHLDTFLIIVIIAYTFTYRITKHKYKKYKNLLTKQKKNKKNRLLSPVLN